MRNRVARSIPKSGNVCPNCKEPVKIGMECIDHAGLDCDGGGFFYRFHRQCFELMEDFGDVHCNGGWHYPFDLVEAADHAAANGDHPLWKAWLLTYEETWAWTPEPNDPPQLPEGTLPWWTQREIDRAVFAATGMMREMKVQGIAELKIDGPFDVRNGIGKQKGEHSG